MSSPSGRSDSATPAHLPHGRHAAPVSLHLLDHLKSLRAVCAVAASGSSVAAATTLHLSQSAVVRAVQVMEHVLATPLFERSGRGMRSTAIGAELALRAQRAFACLAQVEMPGADACPFAPPVWRSSKLAMGAVARHIRTFLALLQAGSESAGAARLGVSQSAVHQTLVQFEHMAGAALFLRTRQGLRASEAGVNLARACKLACAELEQAMDELAAHAGRVQGRLVLGTLPFSTGRLLSEAVERLLRTHPKVQLTIVDGTYAALLEQLRVADLDVIVGALRPALPHPELEQETLFQDPLAVLVRAGHPLAQRSRLDWQDLRSADWIMPMPATPAQSAFEQAFAAAGIPVPVAALRVNSALMMQALLAQGERLALMSPRQLRREIDAGLLTELALPVRHEPRAIGMIRRAAYLPTPAASSLFDALRDVAQTFAAEPQQELRHKQPA